RCGLGGVIDLENMRIQVLLRSSGQIQALRDRSRYGPIGSTSPTIGTLEPIAYGRLLVHSGIDSFEIVIIPGQQLILVAGPGPPGVRRADKELLGSVNTVPGLKCALHMDAGIRPIGSDADGHLNAIQEGPR